MRSLAIQLLHVYFLYPQDDAVVNMRSLAIQLLHVFFLCRRMTPWSTCAVSPSSCCMCTFSASGRCRCQHAQSRHPAVVCVLSLPQDDAVVNMRSLAIQLLYVYFLCPRMTPLSTCAVSPSNCCMCTSSILRMTPLSTCAVSLSSCYMCSFSVAG